MTVDGEVAFDGRTIPGNAYPFDAEQSIEVLAGNGAALRVVYNQRDLGLLGGFGQIARFIYTADEVVIRLRRSFHRHLRELLHLRRLLHEHPLPLQRLCRMGRVSELTRLI